MNEYSVVIFDLDGTITDPKVGIVKSIQYALSKFDIKENNPNRLEQFIGPPLLESFQKHYFPSESRAREAVEYYREYYTDSGIYENEIYSGMPELLDRLHCEKHLIIATSKPTLFAERVLDHFNLRKYFKSVNGSNLDCTHASKNEIIKHIISGLKGIPNTDIVMIGDREQDIRAANENGIDSIAVTYGYGSIHELEGANPTYIAGSVDELRLILRN